MIKRCCVIYIFVISFFSTHSAEITHKGKELTTTTEFEIKALRISQKIISISQLYSPEGVRKNRNSINGSESLFDTDTMIKGIKDINHKKGQEYTNRIIEFILHHSLSPVNQIFPPIYYLRKLTLLNSLQKNGLVNAKSYLEHCARIECYQPMVDHNTVPETIITHALEMGADPRNLLLSLQDKATEFWCQIVESVHPGWLIGIARHMLLQEFAPRSTQEMVFKNYVAAIAKNPLVFGYAQLLSASIKENNLNATQVIIDAGSNVDAENNDGDTPLHEAARYGHAEQINVLLAAGARPKRNKSQQLPQDLVKKNAACLKLFQENL
ncbi:hypothetical protein Noda2021_11480 [Candidatus Dependentiae bacterium Noda2021]|nr:hypothetical protein Noda2021_11480 [Candidatus Dependentiae bacterium Noda2021]